MSMNSRRTFIDDGEESEPLKPIRNTVRNTSIAFNKPPIGKRGRKK